MSFADPSDGWLMVFLSPGRGELLRTTNGGATWFLQSTSQRGKLPTGPIHFLSPSIGIMDTDLAREQLGWWITRDAGSSWSPVSLPLPTTKKSDIITTFGGALVGTSFVIAASYSTPAHGAADGVGIYRSADGGRNWTSGVLARRRRQLAPGEPAALTSPPTAATMSE